MSKWDEMKASIDKEPARAFALLFLITAALFAGGLPVVILIATLISGK